MQASLVTSKYIKHMSVPATSYGYSPLFVCREYARRDPSRHSHGSFVKSGAITNRSFLKSGLILIVIQALHAVSRTSPTMALDICKCPGLGPACTETFFELLRRRLTVLMLWPLRCWRWRTACAPLNGSSTETGTSALKRRHFLHKHSFHVVAGFLFHVILHDRQWFKLYIT